MKISIPSNPLISAPHVLSSHIPVITSFPRCTLELRAACDADDEEEEEREGEEEEEVVVDWATTFLVLTFKIKENTSPPQPLII